MCESKLDVGSSDNFAEEVADPHREQNCGYGPLTNETCYLIHRFIGPVYLPLNRLARIRDGSFWSITHSPLLYPIG
jgi:hypothetical protein